MLSPKVALPPGLGDESVDFHLEQCERHRANHEHGVVVGLRVELTSERRARPVTEFDELQLADHIRARLSGNHNVAFDFACLYAVVDRLLAGPSFAMDA